MFTTWAYTNPDEEFEKLYWMEQEDIQWVAFSPEFGEQNGNKHFQGAFYMKKKVTYNQEFMTRFNGRHIEACYKTFKNNLGYISKDQPGGRDASIPYWEHGVRPDQGHRTDWDDMMEIIKRGQSTWWSISDDFGQLAVRHEKYVKEQISRYLKPRLNMLEVIVIWGPADAGKSSIWRKEGAYNLSYDGKYFGNYNDQPVVAIDDFEDSCMTRMIFTQLTDPWGSFEGRCLYGWKMFTAIQKLYITSNYDPLTWYEKGIKRPDPAIQRRFSKIMDLNPPAKIAEKIISTPPLVLLGATSCLE